MAREAAENASSNGRLVVDTLHDGGGFDDGIGFPAHGQPQLLHGGHGDGSADDVAAADVNLDDGVDRALVNFCNSALQLIACG